jgi:hypothetical protein
MFELIVNHFLGNMPVWVFPFMAGIGFGIFIIAGIAEHIEPVRIYALIARPVSFIVFVLGVFLYGGAGVVAIQQQALLEAQHKTELAEQAAQLGDTSGLEAAILSNPSDHQARFDLALAHAAAGKREEATDALIEIIKRDRAWNDDGARVQLLQFFDAWGPMDEMTKAGRRKLSSLLFR